MAQYVILKQPTKIYTYTNLCSKHEERSTLQKKLISFKASCAHTHHSHEGPLFNKLNAHSDNQLPDRADS